MITSAAWSLDRVIVSDSDIVVFDSLESLSSLKLPITNRTLWSIVCIHGTLKLTVDGIIRKLESSSLMVLAPGHEISGIESSADFSGFAINSTLKNIEAMLPALSRALICYKAFSTDPVININHTDLENQILFYRLLRSKLNCSSPDHYSGTIIGSICQALIFETLDLYMKRLAKTDNRQIRRHTRAEELFYRFILLVEKNYKECRLLTEYARELCVSTKHLSALVKDVSGRTAGSWIDSYVIMEAKRLLRFSRMPIQEISEELHFANQSFFGKYFRNNTGMSPSEYRNSEI